MRSRERCAAWLIALTVSAAVPAWAQPAASASAPVSAPALSAELIEAAASAVAADPLLGSKEKFKTLRFKKDEKKDKKAQQEDANTLRWWRDWMSSLSSGLRIAIWVLGAALLIWILLRLRDWLVAREGGGRSVAVLPTHVGQLDIRPESLPDDVGAEARRLWQAGGTRAALSLLYRGALSRLVHGHGVKIRAASTEGECLRLAAARLPMASHEFLAVLVRNWQGVAYAQREPSADEMERLCGEFDQRLTPQGAAA
jgi:hypothetical protein